MTNFLEASLQKRRVNESILFQLLEKLLLALFFKKQVRFSHPALGQQIKRGTSDKIYHTKN